MVALVVGGDGGGGVALGVAAVEAEQRMSLLEVATEAVLMLLEMLWGELDLVLRQERLGLLLECPARRSRPPLLGS